MSGFNHEQGNIPPVRIDNFDVRTDSVYDVGAVGDGPGVAHQMAKAFEYTLAAEPDDANMGFLIGKVGQAKEFERNIAGVQARLGSGVDGLALARRWANISGLLVPVERQFLSSELATSEDFDVVVATAGTRNWMQRRKKVIEGLAEARPGLAVVLAAGTRPMKGTEGDDVTDGMSESEYMKEVIKSDLEQRIGREVTVVEVDSQVGDIVAAGLVAHLSAAVKHRRSIAVATNAGNWPQAAGSFRRAMRVAEPGFDQAGDQLTVVSDTILLGKTGKEQAATHQNPFATPGQITRNLQEFVRHQD